MHITITSEEVATVIVEEIKQATGMDCETHTDHTNTVITSNHTKTIAQVATLSDVIAVTPTHGPYAGNTTTIPLEAETISGVREIAHALTKATTHVLNA